MSLYRIHGSYSESYEVTYVQGLAISIHEMTINKAQGQDFAIVVVDLHCNSSYSTYI
jgi:hypothetical protein